MRVCSSLERGPVREEKCCDPRSRPQRGVARSQGEKPSALRAGAGEKCKRKLIYLYIYGEDNFIYRSTTKTRAFSWASCTDCRIAVVDVLFSLVGSIFKALFRMRQVSASSSLVMSAFSRIAYICMITLERLYIYNNI